MTDSFDDEILMRRVDGNREVAEVADSILAALRSAV